MKIRYKELREDNDYRQSDIAKLLNTETYNYKQWELLINDMPIECCNKLANLYDVSLDYLLSRTNKKKYQNMSNKINYDLLVTRMVELRKQHKLSQAKLAIQLGFPQATYAGYEIKRAIPTVFKLLTIVDFYHCSLDYLVGRINDSMIPKEQETTNKEEDNNHNNEIKLKKLRKGHNLTQEGIAQKLGINTGAYRQWERLVNDIPLTKCNDIANYYGVSIDYLLGLTNIRRYDNYKTNINFNTMCERLKKLRKEKNLTQKELGNKIGISQTTYSDYEHGKKIPTTFKLINIISYYQVSMDYILGRINTNNIKDNENH